MKKKSSACVALALSLSILTSCGSNARLLTPLGSTEPQYTSVDRTAVNDFALKLFSACKASGENTMLSPLSILCALGMTAEGAVGSTLSQMEEVIGLDRDRLAAAIESIRSTVDSAVNDEVKVKLADSIWIRDERISVKNDFLEKNVEKYSAEIYSAPFDSSTLSDINSWVSEKTDGMIKNILDEIPYDAVMYLVNALSFDGKWAEVYKKHQVCDGEFSSSDGEVTKVEMMSSEESKYISGKGFTGFIKPYSGGKFAFAALLPDEGSSTDELISSLDGEALTELLSNPKTGVIVNAYMPKFETEYSCELSELLNSLGMTDAFDSRRADFSELGSSDSGNIFINRVLHKTFIEVAEQGTRAGAATVVEMVDECAMVAGEYYTVKLDRPFVYIIFETTDCTPLFIGSLEKVK